MSRNVLLAPVYAACAVLSVLVFSTRRRSTDAAHLLRGHLVSSYAYVAAGMLVGAGALGSGGMLGFLIPYVAFSFAWAWWWIRRTLSKAREEPSTV